MIEGGVPACRHGRQQADEASTHMHQRCIDLEVLLPHSTDFRNIYVGHATQGQICQKGFTGRRREHEAHLICMQTITVTACPQPSW